MPTAPNVVPMRDTLSEIVRLKVELRTALQRLRTMEQDRDYWQARCLAAEGQVETDDAVTIGEATARFMPPLPPRLPENPAGPHLGLAVGLFTAGLVAIAALVMLGVV